MEEAGGLVASGSCIEFVHRGRRSDRSCRRSATHRHLDPAPAAVVGDAEPLARLLPELDHHGDDAGDGGAALFEHLLGTIIRLGDRIPTLLLLEDLHWADHSTRDFLVFLARNLRDARVLVVGTFRTDDLHRRHPLRPVLAELERSGAVTRVDLPRFDRDEIAELIAAIRVMCRSRISSRARSNARTATRSLRRSSSPQRSSGPTRCPSRCATSCSRASTRSPNPPSARSGSSRSSAGPPTTGS